MSSEQSHAAAPEPRTHSLETLPDDLAFRRLLRRTALTLLVALLLPTVILGVMVELFRLSAQWVDHTDRVIAEINRVEKLLITMQSGFRGYRLLNEDGLLGTYAKARDELPSHLDALDDLTKDNPTQLKGVQELRGYARQWTAGIEGGIARLARGEDMDSVNRDMLKVRPHLTAALGRIAHLTAEEERLRTMRDATLTKVFRGLMVLIGVAIFVGIPLGVWWITRLLRHVAASYRANLAASARANRAKDDFIAALSHELRTPLTPVLMSASSLQSEPGLSPEVREQLQMMERNVALEARLIDDLLDLTTISRGLLKLRQQPVDAHSLIKLAVDIIGSDARAKNIAIDLNLDATLSGLSADEARFQQAVWNLLRNAVKFTPAGGRILVTTRNLQDADGMAWLQVAVTDSGIGIDPSHLERIFEPFERGNLNGDHRFGGLGLGLAIARAVVTLHGGRIKADSPGKGHGATFTMEFPRAGAAPKKDDGEPATRTASASPIIKPLRLLLVEDHDHTLLALQRLLKRDGHEVVTASSVAAALAMADTTRFDLVISDLGLPDGTGNELMEKLRAHHGLRGIALTGYGMDADLARSKEAGFVAHLIKPVVFAELQRTMAALPDSGSR